MRNDELIHAVKDELERDPDVDSDVVAVSADDGVVRLRGTVESLSEKHEAEKDAKRISATELVDNELQVKPLSNRKDAELRGQVLQALALDEVVPPTVDAKVKDGVVTLTGIVKGQDQLDAAKLVASNVAGDLEVLDQMTLTLEPNARRGPGRDRRGAQAERPSPCQVPLDQDVTRNGHGQRQGEVLGGARRGDRGRSRGSGEWKTTSRSSPRRSLTRSSCGALALFTDRPLKAVGARPTGRTGSLAASR